VSVINKMLRDLDSRQAPAAVLGRMELPATERLDTRRGDKGHAGQRWLRVSVLLGLLALIGAATGGWLLHQRQLLATPVTVVTSAPVMAPIMVSVASQSGVDLEKSEQAASDNPHPPRVGMVFEMAPALESNSWAQAALRMENSFSKRVFQPAPVLKPEAQSSSSSKQPERQSQERPAALLTPNVIAAAEGQTASSRQVPAMEALAQAQSLWKSGSHEAAMDLLHEALASTERAHLAGQASGSSAMLAALVRELARMELAEGRVNQTLVMLARLETALSGVADVWAIRGNAAQRLGRHQESAAAYAMALKLRPEEPRWMLGAAVSLAAQGQTVAAAELAEKARAGGVLSAEVATYLRQLGVVLRER